MNSKCNDWPTANDYYKGSIFMTVEAPDLPLCLSRHHFFCASLYSPPRPGILSLIVRRVFALICSPYHFVHVVLHSFAPLSHALFPKFLRSFAPPVVSCSICSGPLERCCGVCFCLRIGPSPISGVSIVASCTS
jgi:hypothetical protein